MKTKLNSVTLLGIDCVNIDRLIQAAEFCKLEFEFAEIKLLTSLPSTNEHVVQIPALNSTEEYSRFCIENLDKYIDTDHVLIIQYDGFILNPKAWTDEFLAYDYIGSPWKVENWLVERFNFPSSLLGQSVVGNGGFSLRTKKFTNLCAKLAQEKAFSSYHPEDIQLCVHHRKLLEDAGMVFAPVDIAKKFSFEAESEENNKWTDQFGFHGLEWTDISKWTSEHTEFQINNKLRKE